MTTTKKKTITMTTKVGMKRTTTTIGVIWTTLMMTATI